MNKKPIAGMLGPRQRIITDLQIAPGETPLAMCARKDLLKIDVENGFAVIENLGEFLLPYVLVAAPATLAMAASIPWGQVITQIHQSPAAMIARNIYSELKKAKNGNA